MKQSKSASGLGRFHKSSIWLLKFTVFVFLTEQPVLAKLERDEYVEINSPTVRESVKRSLRLAEESFGPHRVLFSNFAIYQSVLKKAKISEHFTELRIDSDGTFVIFISYSPTSVNFAGALYHEVFHMLDPQILDPYMEGLCGVFAEQCTLEEGGNWSVWEEQLRSDRMPFYSSSYLMMKEIKESVSDSEIRSIFKFAVPTAGTRNTHIDIVAWIKTLSPSKQTKVTGIIRKYQKTITEHLPKNGFFVFLTP